MFKTKKKMKKTYIIPAMEAIELKMNCQMLAGSLAKGDDVITNENSVLSRGYDFDDDEEDW